MTSIRDLERRLDALERGQQAPPDAQDLSLTTGEKELLADHFDVTPPTRSDV